MKRRGVIGRPKLPIRHVSNRLFLTVLFFISFFPSLTQAAPGDLDLAFGTEGIVSTSFGDQEDVAHAVAIQSDGKLVAAGYSYNGSQNVFALVRYNTDGTVDTTFNTTGKVTTAIGTVDDKSNALAIQPDGKLVAAGYSYNGSHNEFALARYNTDGSLDITFGTAGIVTTTIGTDHVIEDKAFALVVQPDGKIVAAGYSTAEGRPVFALVRYNTGGTLDSSFGTGGIVTTATGALGAWAKVYALAIQADGKLAAAGFTLGTSNYDFALARYNTDGSLDTTFGTGGIVTADFAINDEVAQSIAIQSDEKLVVAGISYAGTQYEFALARYNTDGNLDSSFGSGGKMTTAIGPSFDEVTSLAIQPDGKLVAAGFSYNGSKYEFALARFNTDGSLDASFGSGGKVTTGMGGDDDEAYAVAIQPDGKIVAAGYTYNFGAGQYKFALARYLGDLTETTTTTTEPATTTTTTTSTTTTTTTSTTTTTTLILNHPPSADSLTPVNLSTTPETAQSFIAVYSDPDGWQDISVATLILAGSLHNERLDYNRVTDKFTMMGVGGDCSPGEATTLSNAYLTINCSTSTVSGSGTMLTVTYNLTPQQPLSGATYRLVLAASDLGGANINRDMGYWVVNRPPHADSVTPMNSTTPTGTQQTFISVYSDPDGYQNIAEANLYLAGGLHNEWLHYVSAANIFFIMGAPGVCTPGQATTLSNGYLTLDCGTSSVLGSGNTLTITFRVTPLGPSSGINYNIFTGASDHAGAAHGLFAGSWEIP